MLLVGELVCGSSAKNKVIIWGTLDDNYDITSDHSFIDKVCVAHYRLFYDLTYMVDNPIIIIGNTEHDIKDNPVMCTVIKSEKMPLSSFCDMFGLFKNVVKKSCKRNLMMLYNDDPSKLKNAIQNIAVLINQPNDVSLTALNQCLVLKEKYGITIDYNTALESAGIDSQDNEGITQFNRDFMDNLPVKLLINWFLEISRQHTIIDRISDLFN